MAEAFKASFDSPEKVFEPVAQAISGLTDADSEYVLNACLDQVQIQQGQIWSKVRVNNRLMFEFIGLAEMMQITFAVLQDNFASFFHGLPAPSSANTPQA
jgi:hypothetical protein